MDSEGKIWLAVIAGAAAVVATLTIASAWTEAQGRAAVLEITKRGVDPIAARCAVEKGKSEGWLVICARVAERGVGE